MLECKNCFSIHVECTDAYQDVYAGREANVEEVECEECGAKGRVVEPLGGRPHYKGSIRAI